MVKPVLQDPVLDKDFLFVEFSTTRGYLYWSYRDTVARGDMLTRKYEQENTFGDGAPLKKGEDIFTQRKAYSDFVKRAAEDFPNLTVLIRLMLAHIPNSVDPERNASNLKLTLTK